MLADILDAISRARRRAFWKSVLWVSVMTGGLKDIIVYINWRPRPTNVSIKDLTAVYL